MPDSRWAASHSLALCLQFPAKSDALVGPGPKGRSQHLAASVVTNPVLVYDITNSRFWRTVQGKYFPKDVGFSFHLVKSLQCVFGKGGKLKLDRMKLLCWTMRSVVKILSVLDTFRFLCPSVASPGVFIVCCVRLHQTATPAGSLWQKSTVSCSRTNSCPLPPLQAQSRHNVRALNKPPHGDRLLKSNTLLDHFNSQNKSFPLRRSQLLQSN